MHYYKRNIGDYAKKAGRLSMLQHGSYTLLIDACYDREQFPTLEEAIEWTWASTTDEVEAVKFVLSKFFTLENGIYLQKRIKEELAEYHAKADTNKRIAIEREAKRAVKRQEREQHVHEPCRSGDEPPPNHKPLTINHKPTPKKEEAPASQTFILPDWINKTHWDAWHSCKKRKGASIEQKRMAVEKLDSWRRSGIDHAAALENAAMAGWQGLFKPDATAEKTSSRTANASKYAGAAKAIWGDDSRTINA